MGKGFGIAALAISIISVFMPYGFNIFTVWVAMLCAAGAVYTGDRAFAVASFIIALAGLVILSPLTMTAVAKYPGPVVPFLVFAPFALPIAGFVLARMREEPDEEAAPRRSFAETKD